MAWSRRVDARWCTAQQAEVIAEGRYRQRILRLRHQGDATAANAVFAGREAVIAAARLGDEDRPAHAITQFHERQQDDVVDDRTDGAVGHEPAEPEDFRVLVTDERRQGALLREGHQSGTTPLSMRIVLPELPQSSVGAARPIAGCRALRCAPPRSPSPGPARDVDSERREARQRRLAVAAGRVVARVLRPAASAPRSA